MSNSPYPTNTVQPASGQAVSSPLAAAAQPVTPTAQTAAPAVPAAPVYPTGVVTGIPGQPASWANNNPYLKPYWYDPRRLARYYHVINNLPPGVQPDPNVIDAPAIAQAYKYLESKNPGKDWMDWEPLPDGDPGQAMLQAIPTPGTALLWPDEQQYASAQMPTYTPPPVQQMGDPALMGLTQAQYDTLPVWQKLLIFALASPVSAGAIGALPAAGIGAAVAGPVGAVVGGVLGAGAAVYAQQHPDSPVAQALNFLDIPRQALEYGVGDVSQIYNSLVDPEKYGTLDELLSNWTAVQTASRLTYETTPILDLANLMAASENLLRGKGFTGAGAGQAWQLGNANPVQVFDPSKDTSDMLVQIRREVMAGGAPEEVFQKYTQLYGLSGMSKELVSGIFLDPLNRLGEVEKFAGSRLAKAAGNTRLATAFEATEGLMEAMQKYGQILRTSDFDTLKNLNPIEQRLAGVNAQGVPTWMIKPTEQNKWAQFGNYLTGLTPSARAAEVIDNGIVTMGLLLKDAKTPEEMVRLVKSMANTPAELARELSMSAINSPDGAAIPLMLRDYKPDNQLAIWEGTRFNRELLANIAEITGRTAEQVLADYAKGGMDFDVTLRQLVDKARASGDAEAKWIVDAFDRKELTGAKLGEMVKGFAKDGLPYNPDMFGAALFKDVLNHGQKWAVEWFGVKPGNQVVRLAQAMKSAQSMVLLGMNPTYLINNTINNIVTMAATGVFGMRSMKEIEGLWNRIGVKPTRLKAGVGVSSLGLDDWSVLREASTQKGLLTDISRLFNEKLSILQPFANASNKVESWSSMQAMSSGYLQAWSKLWRRMSGFDALPAELERALKALDPNLPNFIYDAIEQGLNKSEVETALWSAVARRNVNSYLSDVAAELKLPLEDVQESLHKTGVYDILDAAIQLDPTDDGVRAAFEKVETQIEDYFDEQHARQIDETVEREAAKSRVEGVQAALETYDNDQVDWMSEYMTGSADWDALYQDTLEMTKSQRATFVKRQFGIEKRRWERYYKRAQAALVGIAKGLGLGNSMGRMLVDLGDQLAKGWQDFHAEKGRLLREFWDQDFGGNKARSNLAWEELNTKLDALYRDAALKEQDLNSKMTDLFAEYAAGQYGAAAGEAARAWRGASRDFRQKHVLELRAHFDRIKNMDRAGRLAAWQEFQRGMMPAVLEQVRANLRGAHELYRVATGQERPVTAEPAVRDLEVATRGAAEPAPTPPTAPPDITPPAAPASPTPAAESVTAAPGAPEAARAPGSGEVVPAMTSVLDPGVSSNDPGFEQARLRVFGEMFGDPQRRGNAVEQAVNLPEAEYKQLLRGLSGEGMGAMRRAREIVDKINSGDYEGLPEDLYREVSFALDTMAAEADAVRQSAVMVPDAQGYLAGEETRRLNGWAPDWWKAVAGLTAYDENGKKVTTPKLAVQTALGQVATGIKGKRMNIHTRLMAIVYDRVKNGPAMGRVFGKPWDTEPVYRILRGMSQAPEFAGVNMELGWTEYFDLLGKASEYYDGKALPAEVQGAFDLYEDALLKAESGEAGGAPRAAEARPAEAAVTPADTAGSGGADMALSTTEPALSTTEPALSTTTARPAVTPEVETTGERAARLSEGKPEDARLWEMRQAAQEYGLGADLLASEWQKLAQNLDRAIVQRVNRTLGTRYARLDELSPELVRQAFVRRIFEMEEAERAMTEAATRPAEPETPSAVKPMATLKPEVAVPPEAAALQERARLERTLGEYEATMRDLDTPARSTRETVWKGLREVYGLDEAEAQAVMQLTDARARVWARANGKSPDEWYRTHMTEVRKGVKADLKTGLEQYDTTIRGGVKFLEDGRAVLLAFDSPDVSTAVHEIGHIFRRDLSTADMDEITNWLANEYGVLVWHEDGRLIGDEMLKVDARSGKLSEASNATSMGVEVWAEERFARAFERYLADGKAPTTGLVEVFSKFKNWLLDIYHSLTGSRIDVEISEGMRKVFDRLLADEDEMLKNEFTDAYRDRALADAAPGQEIWWPGLTMYVKTRLERVGGMLSPKEIEAIVKKFGVEPEIVLRLAERILVAPEGKGMQEGFEEVQRIQLEPGSPWYATEQGPRRTLLQEPSPAKGATLFQDADGTIRQGQTDGEPQALSVGQPLGTVDSGESTPPIARVMEQGYRQQVGPVLDRLKRKMLDPQQNRMTSLSGHELDPVSRKAMQQYLHQVYGQMADAKLGAIKWAENRRDAALLNYSARTGFDELAGVMFPYSFWYTRSAIQWALRAMDRPAYIANWVRLRKMQDEIANSPGFPTRLRGKIKIPVPFLPKWAGDGIYIDPLKQLFPFENLLRPFETVMEQGAQNERTAEYNLQAMVQNEEISAQDATEAMRTHKGAVWERALTQATMETEQNVSNPFDFMSLISGPSLPIQWLYQGLIMGRPEKIGSLPITRQWRSLSALMGANQGRGYNLEGPIRRALGMPEIDEFSDYRVDRMLANMATEGRPIEQIMQAMIDRSGPLFVEAEARAAKSQAVTTLGSFVGADLFPEGEQEQRALKLEFDRAVAAKAAGDGQALTKFFDAYPQYEARMAQMKSDPEQRLRSFLIGQVWDGYMAKGDLYQKQLREQLGQEFDLRFMNKETRNYDAISTATLATWAKALSTTSGNEYIAAVKGAPELPLDLASPEVAQAYQTYRDEGARLFPNISGLLNIYYQLKPGEQRALEGRFPQIGEYDRWKNNYFAQHPEVIPYAIGEQNKVARATPEIQALYYQYQASVDNSFPDIYAVQDAYFAARDRRGYLAQHPELSAYWDFRKNYMEMHPQVIPYLYSVEGLRNKVLGTSAGASGGGGQSSNTYSSNASSNYAGQAGASLSSYELRQFSPALVRQLYAYYLASQQLGEGAQRELKRMFEKSGRAQKGQSYEEYVDSVVSQSFR